CRLRSHVLARTMPYRRKNAQHLIRVSDIDNQKHKIHVGTAALGCPAARRAAVSANAVELRSTGRRRAAVPTRFSPFHSAPFSTPPLFLPARIRARPILR